MEGRSNACGTISVRGPSRSQQRMSKPHGMSSGRSGAAVTSDMFQIATWRTAAKSWSAVSSLPPCSHISSGTGSHSKGLRPLVSWFAQQGQRWRDSISLIHRSDLCLRPLHKDKRIGRMATGWLRGVVSYRHTHVAGIHSLRPEYLLHLAFVHDPDHVCCICGFHCQS